MKVDHEDVKRLLELNKKAVEKFEELDKLQTELRQIKIDLAAACLHARTRQAYADWATENILVFDLRVEAQALRNFLGAQPSIL